MKNNEFTEWTYLESYPPDRLYLCRIDVDDFEPDTISVINGEAFKDGNRRIIYGREWKVINPATL